MQNCPRNTSGVISENSGEMDVHTGNLLLRTHLPALNGIMLIEYIVVNRKGRSNTVSHIEHHSKTHDDKPQWIYAGEEGSQFKLAIHIKRRKNVIKIIKIVIITEIFFNRVLKTCNKVTYIILIFQSEGPLII